MPYTAIVLKVMIASPGDVANERRIARDVVHEWNAVHSQDRRTVLVPVAWETHATPAMGERAQEIINKQLLRDSDMLVGIFWTRIGTPTGKAASGTIEEIEEHIRAGKPAMLYFSVAPVRPDSIDEQQYLALRRFREVCQSRGLIEEYESIGEFREKFARQLAQAIIQRFPPTGATSGSLGSDKEVPPGYVSLDFGTSAIAVAFSEEAGQLLKEAVLDRNGTVLVVQTFGGVSVETNERNFAERGNPRSEARWRKVVEELVDRRLLEQRDLKGEVFSITDQGYRVADGLS